MSGPNQRPEPRVNLRQVISDAFVLSNPYWQSEERWRALALLSAIIGLTLTLVAVTVATTYWQRGLFNSLENRDASAFLALLFAWYDDPEAGFVFGFAPLLAVHVICTTYALYLKQALQIRWRTWLTAQMTDQYLSDQAYYAMQLGEEAVDNPDQRIAEDVRLFVDQTLTFGVGFLETFVSMASFLALLWALSQEVSFWGVTVPGSLVWIALAYAGLSTIFTHVIGRRLVPLSFIQQRREADYRFELMQLRESSESVAFHRGEKTQAAVLRSLFNRLADNFRALMTVTKRVTFFYTSAAQGNLVFPLAVTAPAYFSGAIPLGGVFQTANALNRVVENMSWFVSNYIELASYSAVVQRLSSFRKAVDDAHEQLRTSLLIHSEGPHYALRDVEISLPDGQSLLRCVNLELDPGSSLMIAGATGGGKSTLMRTLAGIWPYASGTLTRPSEGRVIFAPQKGYVPRGTLRQALVYPNQPLGHVTDDTLQQTLALVGLDHLSDHLGTSDNWARRLSGGEAQRLVWARIFLQRPDFLFLDEVTSNLDAEWEEKLYSYLPQIQPKLTLVSVAHRPNLARFHDRTVRVDNGRLRF
ncbi:MAG: ABC transporter ATP-binding protein/permease [Pseudomonadota bacterium]